VSELGGGRAESGRAGGAWRCVAAMRPGSSKPMPICDEGVVVLVLVLVLVLVVIASSAAAGAGAGACASRPTTSPLGYYSSGSASLTHIRALSHAQHMESAKEKA